MSESIHLKYLIANEQDVLWGLTVNTVGYQHIRQGEDYPPKNHPTRYLFSAEKGRVLDEYQLLYITQGGGSFASASQKRVEVKAGNMFLLFPGEWHSYKPDKETGWSEYWIGFTGVNIDNRIRHGFFDKRKPVFNVGLREDIVALYKQAIDVAKEQTTGFQQMLAGVVNHLLGFAYSQNKHASFEDMQVTSQINKAKMIMYEDFQGEITPEEVARRVNMSYSWFRRIFKQYTGFAPSQYIMELKIQKSKDLLTNTMKNSREIAFEVGFDNADYFCTVFKRATGHTPTAYRIITQGKNM